MLTLQFVPYGEIENLSSKNRIEKLLDIVKQDKIVLLQGRLKPEEETMLIMETMAQINKKFRGVEICTIYPEENNLQFFNKIKKEMVKFLIGNRDGVTIIGPSTVVKEVRRNPNKIELFTLPGMKGLKSKSIARRKTTKKKIASRKRTTRTVKRTVKRRRR
ncbi:DUF2073 domain-containing protein [Candidatus Woesearchaeota archaeon]|nr:DUF2073 domain-containing protein [Candidatus Woesearchaeota archaeon]MBT6045025.1 DUF2073 domain-containing protein [Candidatus Woesearchaeota archaeon]